jgi:pyruvate,water dikinase
MVIPVGTDVGALSPTSPLVAAIRAGLGPGPLIARSSSPWEDGVDRSMAGRFVSLPSLGDDVALAAAIPVVARSGERVALEDDLEVAPPVAVLVQPMVHGVGGVCFGMEPVTGRSDRLVAVVSAEGPEAVAEGRVAGMRHLLTPDGRVIRRDGDERGGRLSRGQCQALVSLVADVGALFGGPQDVEFLFEPDGTLRLLQSRPVTTEVRGPPIGPVYGPGPVAETFPDPLGPLEVSLWVDPLRAGLREALRLSALAGEHDLSLRPLVVVADGRVAMDLELVGALPPRRRWMRLDLRGRGRRAWATWRVGRLRAALPSLARDVVQHADALLDDVGPLHPLTDRQLVGMMDRSRTLLRSLHGYEILMGLLVVGSDARLTGVSVAMRTLAAGRRDGLGDDEIVARSPVVLALTGPRIEAVRLPRHVDDLGPSLPGEASGDEAALLREALRLRVRWVQELTVRAARLLGARLADRGWLPSADAVVMLGFDGLAEVVAGTARPDPRLVAARHRPTWRDAPPLPARFRLDAEGRVIPLDEASGDGTGAGGGRGRGRVVHDPEAAGLGTVLVVRQLSPDLAWVLPKLAGLVAETGSPLAHLAILAREASVPTVVGSPGATTRFEVGAHVEIDGTAGTVTRIDGGEEGP